MAETNHPKAADTGNEKAGTIFRVNYIIPLVLIIALVGYTVFRGLSPDDLHVAYKITMDTTVELRFSESDTRPAGQIEDEVFAEIERLEMLFSRSTETSDVSRINASAGEKPVQVSDEVLYVTRRAVEYAEMTDGAFDPSIAPLIDLWGFLGQEFRVPSGTELKEALLLVDYTMIEIDRGSSAVFLPQGEMALELGGIAKGYIVDRALEMLRSAGIEHAFVNAGGDIGLIGSNPEGDPWRIGVRHPRDPDTIIAVFSAEGGSVVTSGDYERSFEEDGIKYHHILEPETGLPARELASVTIMAETAIEADALSTAVFVLGPDRGLDLIEKIDTAEGILITPAIDILVSSGLDGALEFDR